MCAKCSDCTAVYSASGLKVVRKGWDYFFASSSRCFDCKCARFGSCGCSQQSLLWLKERLANACARFGSCGCRDRIYISSAVAVVIEGAIDHVYIFIASCRTHQLIDLGNIASKGFFAGHVFPSARTDLQWSAMYLVFCTVTAKATMGIRFLRPMKLKQAEVRPGSNIALVDLKRFAR